MECGGTSGAVMNAANEVVVEAFLAQNIPFGSMVGIVTEVLENNSILDASALEAVVEADREARVHAAQLIASYKVNS